MNKKELLEKAGVKNQSIFLDIFLTIITFGLFNLWVQFRQIEDTNALLNKESYSFIKVFLFSILTLGLYFCFHEYKLTKTLMKLVHNDDSETVPIIASVLTFFGAWFIVDAFQQNLINDYLEQMDQYPSE